MRVVKMAVLFLVFVLGPLTVSAKEIPFPEISRITSKALKSMLGDKDIVIIDVRLEEQWQVADSKIMRAVHWDPKKYKTWAKKHSKDQILVFYCA